MMPEPNKELWEKSAAKYKELWNFPNCIAAIDGKHIQIRCPINAGSTFYNYKGTHSIVLLALVDPEYKFIAVDVGSYGRNSDGSVFANSKIGKKLERNLLGVPPSIPLFEHSSPQPHVIVGDEAFPLKTYLLRPYSRHHLLGDESKKIFNYRLSRARRIVENAFGILTSRWRVFLKPLEVQPETVDKVVLAACCLHNMLCKESSVVGLDASDTEPIPPNRPNAGLQNLNFLRGNALRQAFQIRDAFKDYFVSPFGAVPWQEEMVRRGRINE